MRHNLKQLSRHKARHQKKLTWLDKKCWYFYFVTKARACVAECACVGGAGGGWAVSRDGDSGEITAQFTLLHSPPPTPADHHPHLSGDPISIPGSRHSSPQLAQLTTNHHPHLLFVSHLHQDSGPSISWRDGEVNTWAVTPAHKTSPIPFTVSRALNADLQHCTQTTSAPGTALVDHTHCRTASASELNNSSCDGSGGVWWIIHLSSSADNL